MHGNSEEFCAHRERKVKAFDPIGALRLENSRTFFIKSAENCAMHTRARLINGDEKGTSERSSRLTRSWARSTKINSLPLRLQSPHHQTWRKQHSTSSLNREPRLLMQTFCCCCFALVSKFRCSKQKRRFLFHNPCWEKEGEEKANGRRVCAFPNVFASFFNMAWKEHRKERVKLAET